MKSDLKYGLHQQFPLNLTKTEFHQLVLSGVVADGRAGGLILGRSYSRGGIFVVHQLGKGFFINSAVEGGEFVLNWEASARNFDWVGLANAGKAAEGEEADKRDNPPDTGSYHHIPVNLQQPESTDIRVIARSLI